MNQHLQSILDMVQRDENLTAEQKAAIADSLTAADKELEITAFKLDRTEKVKRTTAILLEETIDELEQKRKAIEAQNRELQIEGSLERVRSTAMSMQSSEELGKVVSVVLNNLHDLGFVTENGAAAHLIIFNSATKDFVQWSADPFLDKPVRSRIPYTAMKILSDFFEEKEKGIKFFTKVYPREQKNEFFEYAFVHSDLKNLPNELKQLILASETYTHWMAIEENSAISVNSMTGGQLSDYQIDILKRFARVFEQAYVRFLDLQKAEAQAREAQIEAGLERVRSATMAMHKSVEVTGVAVTLNEELLKLGFKGGSTIIIIDKDSGDTEQWTGFSEDKTLKSCPVPYFKHPYHDNLLDAWKRNEKFLIYTVAGEEKKSLDEHYFKTGYSVFPERDKKWMREMESVTFSHAFMKFGAIHWGPHSLTEEQLRILHKFSTVFEQSYTRFRDLQKAEAQAKEAMIEAALERVRSKSMAMHNSNDLLLVIEVLKDQLQQLGFELDAVNFITDLDQKGYQMWLATPGGTILKKVYIPRIDYRGTRILEDAVKNRTEMVSYVLTKEEKDFYFKNFFESPSLKEIPEEFTRQVFDQPGMAISLFVLDSIVLTVASFKAIPLSDEQNGTIRRFAKVFEQSYTRFLDLQKAEAQTRESHIELALERVRARTMAMQHSDELSETAAVLFQQFNLLGEEPERMAIEIVNEEDHVFEIWATAHGGSQLDIQFRTSLDEPHVMQKMYKAWKEKRKSITIDLQGIELEEYFQYLKQAGLPVSREVFGKRRVQNVATFSKGILTIITPEPKPAETIQLLERFAAVFDGTYTRFKDLQKAEAQAKEARVEAALERVRSRSLAMHNSEELQEVVTTVFDQLRGLGIETDAINLDVFNDDKKNAYLWTAVPGFSYSQEFHVPYNNTVVFRDIYEGMAAGKDLHAKVYTKEEKDEFLDFVFANTDFKHIPQERKAMLYATEASTVSVAYAKHIAIIAQRYREKLFSKEENEILVRFAKVFEQAYVRFLDLQKAEAQAREAMIEASLERIRAKAMAMHRSEEIDEVLEVLFDQFDVLGIIPMSTHLTLIDVESNTFTFRETGKGGRKSFGEQKVSIDSMDIWKEAADKWKAMEPLSLNKLHFPKESLPIVWQVFHESFASMPEGHKITPEDYPDGIYHTAGNCKFGYIGMNQVRPATEEEEQIVLKFAVEFGRLYQRYLDLQKAEAQTKEAKIEAALERVRSSSLAMHKSEELKNVVKVVFENLESLGIKNINSVNINILHPDTKDFDLWLAAPGQDYTRNFRLPYFDHPIANDFFEAVKNGETLHRKIYSFEAKNKYFAYMFEHSDNRHLPEERKKLILAGPAYAVSAAITKYSSIFIHNYSGIPFSDEENNILLRFARVFDQTYTRFLDLQKVEAQTREAMIEASLERVRGKAMAMHSSQDLAGTIAAFYNELETFSITPRRCGVGLLNKETRIAELSTMNTTGEGGSIEIVGTLKMEGHPVLEGVYENWILKKEYHPVLRGAEIPAYYRLVRPQIPFPDYPSDAVQYGYFFFFPEGGVYAWTEKKMEEEELVIYRRFTSVLSLTYKRYKDLQQAEELAKQATEDLINLKIEKKRTEDALTELKNTQSQLVQAEKMASLGELTAGIAHEIQNPLNFVNNFSDVSAELLDEMKEQLAMGNKEEAIGIAEDIKQNLEKILHHGKRADSIVKGMLQHSRSSSGQKELTDINTLADEYLRLAFHGLRAKDKSFNADLKTDFDNSLSRIEIVPQEIGRVLVNLLNNAFYTVNEKRKKQKNGYEPVVTLSTRKKGDSIEIVVNDNGNGIPKDALDKIFQPFFTTKPTGQGTGLGLSLSYDIIKSHGGELKVETQEGEGSRFILQLPAR